MMSMYSFIEYTNNCSKKLAVYGNTLHILVAASTADSESFKFKNRLAGSITAVQTDKNINMVVPIKDLGMFWRTLQFSLINFQRKIEVAFREVLQQQSR